MLNWRATTPARNDMKFSDGQTAEMMRAFAVAMLIALAIADADAGEAIAELGDVRVTYDDARWRTVERHGRIEFAPQGENAHRMDGAVLRVSDGDGDNACSDLALRAFEVGHYDTNGLAPTPVVVGGIPGQRFEAHTRCRNATPRGVAICVKHGAYAYLLQSLNSGCRGNNLFSGIDPLNEIAAQITFTPASR